MTTSQVAVPRTSWAEPEPVSVPRRHHRVRPARVILHVFLVVTALVSAYTATFRFAVIAELVAWAFSLAGASFFPALVMGI